MKTMNPNEVKLISEVLFRLQKQLGLYRASLGGVKDKECLRDEWNYEKQCQKLFTTCNRDSMKHRKELFVDPSNEERRLMIDCWDVENAIQEILQALAEPQTDHIMKEIIHEYEKKSALFAKHQKCLEAKKMEIEELKQILVNVRHQVEASNMILDSKDDKGKDLQKISRFSYVEELMEFKLNSKKQFYEHLFKEAKEKITWIEREADVQRHANIQTLSFWLLKFKANCDDLDQQLRKTFDCWTSKEREVAILKKYQKLNYTKMKKAMKEISIREEVIEADRIEKEIKKQKHMEEERKTRAAVIIQAFWRGSMVRKHLGPYKIKKKKKKGKKKKKLKRKE